MKKDDILKTRPDSNSLCKLAEQLGYKGKGRFAINQLQCNNGAFVSSLLSFLDDNPDACDTIIQWTAKYYGDRAEYCEDCGCDDCECDEEQTEE